MLANSIYFLYQCGFFFDSIKEKNIDLLFSEMSSKQIDMQELLELVNKGNANLEKANAKEAVFIFGKAGVGKSTLINFLMGFGFKEEEEEEDKDEDEEEDEEEKKREKKKKLVRINNLNILGPQIYQGVMSCTLIPDIYYVELPGGMGVYFIDTPGVGNNRCATEDMFSKISLQIAIRRSTSIKAVIAVVEECQIETERGLIFSQIAQTLFSNCNGSEFHGSFFLFVTKTKSNQKKIIKTLRNQMNLTQQAAEKLEKNPKKSSQAQYYREVEAVISIFLSTKNIAVVNPQKEECREKLLNIIKNSKTISKSCIGKAMNSKAQNELKNIFSRIAIKGSGKFSEISKHLDNIHQKQQIQRIEHKRVQTLDKELEENQDEITKSETTINQKEVEIQITQRTIQIQQAKLNTYKTDKSNLENKIKAKEVEQTQEEKEYKKTSNDNKSKLVEVEKKREQIKNLSQKIEKSNSLKTSSKNTIDQNISKINVYKSQIKAAKQILGNGAKIDEDYEVKQFLSTYNHFSEDLKQKNSVLSVKKSALSTAQSNLSQAQNDQSTTQIYNQQYCVATVYGTVKKGIIHTHKFQYFGNQLIVKIEKSGTIKASKGSDGFWSSQSKGDNYYYATYNTPSHEYGKASFKVYGYYRNSLEGLGKINKFQQVANNAKAQKDSAESERNQSQNRLNNALLELNKKRQAVKTRLNNNINSWEKKITSCNAIIDQNKKNLDQPDMKNWENQLAKLNTQVSALMSKMSAQDSLMKEVEAKVNQIKGQISIYRENQKSKQKSITTSEVEITSLKKLVEKYQAQIQVNKSSIETQKKIIAKNHLNKKQSQDQLALIAASINSQIDLTKKQWKEFYQIEAKGSFNCMKSLYNLMELNSIAIGEFIFEYGEIEKLAQKCRAHGIENQEIKKEVYAK